jgi:hypothetical protein
MKDFLTLTEILRSKKNVPILSELKKNISDNNQWIQVFDEILSKLPYQKTKGIIESIIRITENQSKSTLKKNKTKGLELIVRLDSNSAVTRFKLIAPLILRNLSQKGINVTSIKPSVSDVKT